MSIFKYEITEPRICYPVNRVPMAVAVSNRLTVHKESHIEFKYRNLLVHFIYTINYVQWRVNKMITHVCFTKIEGEKLVSEQFQMLK